MLPSEITFCKKYLLKDPDIQTIFDIGSRQDSIYHKLNLAWKVYLFDPVDCSNAYKKYMNAKFFNVAMGNELKEEKFFPSGASFINRFGSKESITVTMFRIKDFCFINKIDSIDFLKIDTESWDFEVMKGCDELILAPKYIQFEADWKKYGYDNTMQDIMDYKYFKKKFFYNIGGKPRNFVITDNVIDYPVIRKPL